MLTYLGISRGTEPFLCFVTCRPLQRLGQKDAGSNKVPTVQVISPDTVSHVGLRSPAETDVTAIHTPRPGADEMDDQVMEEQGDNTGGNLSSVTQRASEMLTQAQETGKRAMRVTVERVQEMLGAAKEAVGIDKDKPIGDATREAASTVSQKVQSSIEQAMANMNITASQAAGGVVTAPTAVQDFYKHGRRLVEEKEKEKEKGKGKGKEKESEGSGERGAPHEVTDPIMDIPIEDATAAVPSQGKSDQMVSSATWPQA
jgi:hypothetical protein